MVTAPPVSGPLGEDAACRARRLAPGLPARPGSLRSGGPAGSLPGSGHQVSRLREGGGRGGPARVLAVPASTLAPEGAEASRSPLRPFPPPPPLLFLPGRQPEKEQLMERLRETAFKPYPKRDNNLQQLDLLTHFLRFQ